MPELPEVESTARFLDDRIAGSTIRGVDVRWERTVASHAAADFGALILGRTIVKVGRRGKFLMFTLDPGTSVLFAHLRMSGSFDVLSAQAPNDRHDRIVLSLSNRKELRFNDPRKFGRFYLADTADVVTGRLGIEPLAAEFTTQRLTQLLAGQRARIKPFLLRQDRIAGLGNIYVDEALWYAKVHPLRSAESLKQKEIAALHRGIQKILTEAIAKAGTDFGDGVVDQGGYSPRVYGREGEGCRRCRGILRKIVVGQRGTHYCLKCQRAPRRR